MMNRRGAMRVRMVVAVLGGGLAAVASSRGQSAAPQTGAAVRGVAFDSLRSVPLEGAFIRMAGASGSARTATSDARGEFVFDGVPPGTYTFSMLHEALDSLGFGGISLRTAVGESSPPTVHLSIPSFATLWHRACSPGAVPTDTGFVFGTVRDAERGTPLAAATVVVRWIALGVEPAKGPGTKPGVSEQAWGGEVRSDSAGGYTLCGVPSDATLHLLARKDSASSGLLELLPRAGKTPRVERRDFSIAPASDSATTKRGVVAGLLRDAEGHPVADARVLASGADEVRSGADGRFVMSNVPIGTREVAVLAIGAQPVTAAADVTTRDTAFLAIELRKIVELAPVVVTAKTARQRLLAEFEERKALGMGHFIDSTRLEPFNNLQNAISLAIDPDAVCPLWIDGTQEFITNRDIARELYTRHPSQIAMIETHPLDDPSLPERFRAMPKAPRSGKGSDCGSRFKLKQVVLIWTKNWLP